ncbi:MAG: tyrosine-type recombinase/integrase [Alphaproteobacteria bacterium]|nr:tyrosine-type recombinase/integrase [Alphaproteobacteria bacterium]
MPLTDAQIRSLKPGTKRIRRSDGAGLYLDVMPSGRKVFRLAYRYEDKQRTLLFGDYPKTRLADARIMVAQVKSSLRNGIDPQAPESEPEVQSAKITLWKTVAHDYLKLRQQNGAAPRTMVKLDRQIGVTINAVGNQSIENITAQNILDVVNPIAEKGQVENAHEIRSRFSQIFRYAVARGVATHDPAAVTIDAMVKRRRGEFSGVTDPKSVGALMRAIQGYQNQNPVVGAALLLSAYLFPRNSELRGMLWDEIDWEHKIWEIPAGRMKMKRNHLIPLPIQAIEVIKGIQEWNFGSPLVFPSPRDRNRMVSDMTFNSALRRLGYTNDIHVHHGFRTTASTNLNEMGWNADWIERQLAHVPANKVRSSYNKAEYLDGRVEMMQAYADWLDKQSTTAS